MNEAKIETLVGYIMQSQQNDENNNYHVLSIVIQCLSGWEFDLFNCLESIENHIFSLSDVYVFEETLSELHPDNYNIKAKIRQQLQCLRDLGLIEFKERGVYRKLWKL